MQSNTSTTIPLVQGVEKLWRNMHAPCNAETDGEASTTNILVLSAPDLPPPDVDIITVVEGTLSNNRVCDAVALLNENSPPSREYSGSLVGPSEGACSSLSSAVVARSSSMVPEESHARSTIVPPMSNDRVSHNSVAMADTQAALQDVPITLEVESLRPRTEDSEHVLESVGCSNIPLVVTRSKMGIYKPKLYVAEALQSQN
ncbi:hypothetical protein V6N11_034704 [Hibiscus sabdariffa]|uniref:Uncharacterized protein n=1 Tax=Hibiscus sabdariffa TaxID=183260 RepID=A0ABR2NEB4_9ROSI